MKQLFYFIRDFLAPQRAAFYFIMNFLSDASGHLYLWWINLEWPYVKVLENTATRQHMIFIQCLTHHINKCGRRIVVSWLYLKWRITPTDKTVVYPPHLAIWTPHRTRRSAPTESYNSWLNCNYMRKHVWHLAALSWYIQLVQCFIPYWVFEMNTSQALHILKNPNIRQSCSHAE